MFMSYWAEQGEVWVFPLCLTDLAFPPGLIYALYMVGRGLNERKGLLRGQREGELPEREGEEISVMEMGKGLMAEEGVS